MEQYFQYGVKEIEYLKQSDEQMAKVIDAVGMINRKVNPNLFSALINTIVGQQISTKAQKTIWNRMNDGLLEISPEVINEMADEDLQKFGLSFRKVQYMKHASSMILSGELNIESLYAKSDKEVVSELTKIHGVGVWTAEMLMLFSMQRPDIVSFGDLAIRRGIGILYGVETISKEIFNKYRERYSPYGSVASLYLWAVSAGDVEF